MAKIINAFVILAECAEAYTCSITSSLMPNKYVCPINFMSNRLSSGMAIPWRISFLEESSSRGMTNLHSSGIEEYVIYSSGSSGNFEEGFVYNIPVSILLNHL